MTLDVPGIGHTSTVITSPDGSRNYLIDNYVTPTVLPMTRTEYGWELAFGCKLLAPLYGGLEDLKRGLHPITQNGSWEELEISQSDQAASCFGPSVLNRLQGRVIASIDPNDKTGSAGAGENHYVSCTTPLSYTIRFENLASATAPAQEVLVLDTLDTETLDLGTFGFGPISFGDSVVVPPPGARSFTTEVDLQPEQPRLVRIDAFLEEHSGVAVWKFTSLDPVTRTLPESPLVGFLPPNANPPEGDGSLFYTIHPKTALATGSENRSRSSLPGWSRPLCPDGVADGVVLGCRRVHCHRQHAMISKARANVAAGELRTLK